MRLRWTHDMVVLGERQVGENEVGTSQTVTDQPIIKTPARVHTSREEIDLDETGARIEREPYAVVPVHGHDPTDDSLLRVPATVEVGMDAELTDRMTTGDEHLQILSVDMERGRGNAPATVVLGLERLGDDAGGSQN